MADLSKELNKELSKDFAYCEDALGRAENAIGNLPSAQPEKRTEKRTEAHACDCISRQAAIDAIDAILPVEPMKNEYTQGITCGAALAIEYVKQLPSAQLGQRYTNEELMIFQHGISLSLLSKRSAQHWRYDENTATEIKFLERLYEKVSANMRGGQNE